MTKYTQAPTTINATTPVKVKPPTGLTFVDLECGFPDCQANTQGIEAGAKALGWKVKVIPFDSANPATLTSGMQQALQYHPVAVSINGLPEAVWAQEVSSYKKAGVIIIPIDIGSAPTSPTIPIDISGKLPTTDGELAGDEFIAQSGGKGKALLVNLPTFPVVQQTAQSILSTIKSGCTSCSVSELNVTIAQQEQNAIVPAVVSAVQRDPSVKYIIATNGSLIPGLPAALSGAGVSGVTILGAGPTVETEQQIKNGTESAFVGQNFEYEGLLALDTAIRHYEKMPILPDGGGFPAQILTKDNIGTPSDTLNAPSDELAQFEKLWKLG